MPNQCCCHGCSVGRAEAQSLKNQVFCLPGEKGTSKEWPDDCNHSPAIPRDCHRCACDTEVSRRKYNPSARELRERVVWGDEDWIAYYARQKREKMEAGMKREMERAEKRAETEDLNGRKIVHTKE